MGLFLAIAMPQHDSYSPMPLSLNGGQGHFVTGEWLWEWRQTARQQAIAHAVPLLEVDWVLQQLTQLERLELRLETFRTRSPIALAISAADLEQLWQQRLTARVPVQYLVGRVAWRNFSLQVSPAVLIPRPETELLIDWAIAATVDPGQSDSTTSLKTGHWVDLGTGSGAIALGLAQAFPDAQIHAVDCSAAALAIAQANAAQYQLTSRLQFYHGSWLEPLPHLRGQITGIVANPPYIPSQMVLSLQPEVTRHEPHLALDGGIDGLDCVRQLVIEAPAYLRSGGVWLVELMAGQAETVAALLAQHGAYEQIQIHPDLAGIQRFVSAYRRSPE